MGTLEELLRMKVPAKDKDKNPIDITPEFRVSVQGEFGGGIHFLIHAMDHNSDTCDFVAKGDEIKCLK